ncbi:hypothetical protein AB0D42_13550 [Streptomyces sp. NPDC048304]|uniref:hypothetical protein n=1 Tax=Streptomyces sp. NPDC048304 TaxID=3154820 RepID=UPI0033F6F576
MGYVKSLDPGSSDFGHLLKHEPLLVTLGCAAESYVHTDPHAAMVKTRLFGEVMEPGGPRVLRQRA